MARYPRAPMISAPSNQAWFQTDDAWSSLPEDLTRHLNRIDVRAEARALRFITTTKKIDAFAARHTADFRPFTLFGSGDFHHLSGVWTRQFTEPFHIISFDNHPDWAITPPPWSCGAWVNRALENPLVQGVSIWGCGNFECNFPGRLLGNRRAAKSDRLLVQPWAQPKVHYPLWLHPIRRDTWRDDFTSSLVPLAGKNIYVTIDLDCLENGLLFTNWESGLFSYNDIEWALKTVRSQASLIGGDLCGAWSLPDYATPFQRLAARFDHPKVQAPDSLEHATRQAHAFRRLWPVLTGSEGT